MADTSPQGHSRHKKTIGTYPGLNGVRAWRAMYVGAKINTKGEASGDRFTPIYLDIFLRGWYNQSRVDPSVTVT